MLFSVIVPTFNRAKFLRAALDSVQAQEFKDYETIVVDDGSTDETMSILERYPWIQVLRQDNKGPGAARNYGVRQASGEYFAFLDSDDLWFPWTLDIFAELVRRNMSPSIVATKDFEFRNDRELQFIKNEPLKAKSFPDYFATTSHEHFVRAMGVIRHDRFTQCGGFINDHINAEDHDMIMRLGTAPGFIRVETPYTLAYRRHEAAETASFPKSYAGAMYLIHQEQRGRYPGGNARVRERRKILSMHIRPVALAALKNAQPRKALGLYRKTLGWHLHQRRWKFLVGFPLLAMIAILKKRQT
jgi:glycosyltransferase involved in cell wall biosynthesis